MTNRSCFGWFFCSICAESMSAVSSAIPSFSYGPLLRCDIAHTRLFSILRPHALRNNNNSAFPPRECTMLIAATSGWCAAGGVRRMGRLKRRECCRRCPGRPQLPDTSPHSQIVQKGHLLRLLLLTAAACAARSPACGSALQRMVPPCPSPFKPAL